MTDRACNGEPCPFPRDLVKPWHVFSFAGDVWLAEEYRCRVCHWHLLCRLGDVDRELFDLREDMEFLWPTTSTTRPS